MAGALDGVRVIDFGQYIAGPLAAQLLGDQGAEVIRIDPPPQRPALGYADERHLQPGQALHRAGPEVR